MVARIVLPGEVPSPSDPPTGCTFHPRCPLFEANLCELSVPALLEVGGGTRAACHVVARERVMA